VNPTGINKNGRSRMNEASYKRGLVYAVRQLPGGWARRIEDKYAVGVLDLIIKLPGHPVIFSEGKHLKDTCLFRPTDRQWEEGLQLEKAGIRCLLLGWKRGLMYISPWAKQADVRELTGWTNHLAGIQSYMEFYDES
jgi:hypothetical protein